MAKLKASIKMTLQVSTKEREVLKAALRCERVHGSKGTIIDASNEHIVGYLNQMLENMDRLEDTFYAELANINSNS